MTKIVVTEKFLETLMHPLLENIPVTQKSKEEKIEREKIELLCQALKVDCSLPVLPRLNPKTNKFSPPCLQSTPVDLKLLQLTSLFNKSVNQVLHEYLPSEYQKKNTKLSNFRFENLLKYKSEKPNNILLMLQKSFFEDIYKQNQIISQSQKNKVNMEKCKKRFQTIKMNLKKNIIPKIINDKIPKWKDILLEFEQQESTNSQKGNFNENKNNNRLIEFKDKNASDKLFAIYENKWKQSKDFSIRNVCNLNYPTALIEVSRK